MTNPSFSTQRVFIDDTSISLEHGLDLAGPWTTDALVSNFGLTIGDVFSQLQGTPNWDVATLEASIADRPWAEVASGVWADFAPTTRPIVWDDSAP